MIFARWEDWLRAFRPASTSRATHARCEGVQIRRWDGGPDAAAPERLADVVIEAFGCGIPRATRTRWPTLARLRHGSFSNICPQNPGWRAITGLRRLIRALPWTAISFSRDSRRRPAACCASAAFSRDATRFNPTPAAQAGFWRSLGVSRAVAEATVVSLFCYPDAPLAATAGRLGRRRRRGHCVVPEGVATGALDRWTAWPRAARRDESLVSGRLVVAGIPFVAQDDYDRLLWASRHQFRARRRFVRARTMGRAAVRLERLRAGRRTRTP